MPSGLSESLLENDFVSVRRTLGPIKLIRVLRTSVDIETLEQIDEAWGTVMRVLMPIDKPSHVLLIDMRNARPRNDEAFERSVAQYRASTVRGFSRVAVLVKSVSGELQVQRHVREDRLGEVEIFGLEQEALDWLEGGPAPSKKSPSSRPSKNPPKPTS